MGWYEDIERVRASTSTSKLVIGGALSLLASVVLLATGRTGESVAALVLGAVMSFFGFLMWRAGRQSRPFEE